MSDGSTLSIFLYNMSPIKCMLFITKNSTYLVRIESSEKTLIKVRTFENLAYKFLNI